MQEDDPTPTADAGSGPPTDGAGGRVPLLLNGEEAAEVALTALDEQVRYEMEAIQEALARIDAGT